MVSNPIQQLAQELLSEGVTESEEVIAAAPKAFPEVSEGEIRIQAFLAWEAAGAVPDSPYTLNFWLQAEDALKTESPMVPPVTPPQE